MSPFLRAAMARADAEREARLAIIPGKALMNEVANKRLHREAAARLEKARSKPKRVVRRYTASELAARKAEREEAAARRTERLAKRQAFDARVAQLRESGFTIKQCCEQLCAAVNTVWASMQRTKRAKIGIKTALRGDW